MDDALGSQPGYEIVAPIPAMFLIGQSIELSLKAYLLAKGVELRTLRTRYGHKLVPCMEEARSRGLASIVELTTEDEAAIEVLDPLYASKQLQYIVTGSKRFPIYGPLEGVALKLLEAIAKHVRYPPSRLPHAFKMSPQRIGRVERL